MRAVDVIRRKRDGGTLSPDEIDAFVSGAVDGSWPDYQVSALLMAILLRGMVIEEAADLTRAMIASGTRLDFSGTGRVAVDKHSTGGVGDKTSLILAPLAAACGALVPMMSGRGLGHTGGTLDKLEAIPGFRTDLTLDEMHRVLDRAGCVLIGQTKEIAPADRKLYALRDVTGTVESRPLICASILSKKIAEGIGGLVMDVKTGDGAFMRTEEDARELASWLVEIAGRNGVRTEALITSMDAPLGRAVGNANEVVEAIETLKGQGPKDLEDLSVELAARLLVLAGLTGSLDDGVGRVRRALTSGAGVEKLRDIIALQGGDPGVIDDYSLLPAAAHRGELRATRDGHVTALHADLVGRAAVVLGAGRDRLDSAIDPAVGIEILARVGDRVRAGDVVLVCAYNDRTRFEAARTLLVEAIEVTDRAPSPTPLIIDVLTREHAQLFSS